MSITLWDLKGLCGLPVCGAPFDECTPPNAVLSQNPLAMKIIDLLEEVSRATKKDKFTARGWVELFSRISNSNVSNDRWPATAAEFRARAKSGKKSLVEGRLWLSLERLREIEPEVELALFLWLWLSIVICPSSSAYGLVKWSCLLLACEMAQGKLFALVLCDIYRGLNHAVYHEQGPGWANTYFPAHFSACLDGLLLPAHLWR